MAKYSSNMQIVRGENGLISKSRVIVLEALEALQHEGATLDELEQLIGGEFVGKNPRMSIGKALHNMQVEDVTIERGGRWYIAEFAPAPITYPARPSPQTNGTHKTQVAPFAQKRSGKTLSIYTSPEVLDNVISITLQIAERWYKVPMFGSIRLCIGHETPMWSPEQETYSDVALIRITLKDGTVVDRRPNPKDLVTIAPEL